MKKYLSILLVLLFLVGVVSPTFAVGDAVTDEVKAEIKTLLERYNDFILIYYKCDGALDYDESIQYCFEVNYFPYGDEETFYAVPSICGYRVSDERYGTKDALRKLVFDTFIEEDAERFFNHLTTTKFGYPIYHSDGQHLYTDNTGFKKNAILPMRYIDIGTAIITSSEKGYIVTARGSSQFSEDGVEATDSNIKLLISNENGGLKLAYMKATKDSVEENFSFDDEIEILLSKIEAYNTFAPDKSKCYLFSTPYTIAHSELHGYLLNGGVDFSDIYDIIYDVYDKSLANSVYTTLCVGDGDYFAPSGPFYFENEQGVFCSTHTLEPIVDLRKDALVVETENDCIIYQQGEHFFYRAKDIDVFGDGQYEFLIYEKKSIYSLTDEEKALLGIE